MGFFFFVILSYDPLLMNSHSDCSRSYLCQAKDDKQPLGLVKPQYTTMIKMLNQNMTQRVAQKKGLGVIIDRYSPDSQRRRTGCYPANVGCSSFSYMNDDLRNHTNQRCKQKTWTKQDNQLAIHCYFRSNPTQRGYRKIMIEIWQKCAHFQTTNQKLPA